ncbi:hypothetical protein B0T10DRAFT_502212 [Thelonectria olida]|uniref:F-box domain-containing protein n=1 Tax=Thelonectria olida TaxID=1576542 RepID=A0A9P8VQD7_9HYPO|nr:hypothetical protein B0T10DRAFT_502212 [Thelonectria olida]
MASATSSSSPNYLGDFSHIPLEICREIFSRLPNGDIKNLRLTSSFFNAASTLRFDRIFISANPRNIEVVHAVANHNKYRQSVSEIVWDDARFANPRPQRTYSGRDISWSEEDDCPKWFAHACKENIHMLKTYNEDDVDRPETIARQKQLDNAMSLPKAWALHEEFRHQQDHVIAIGADQDAFRYALARFPAVRTITITPAAHGVLFAPLYATPMIRSFPPGFVHAVPRGWPTEWGKRPTSIQAPLWGDADEQTKDLWRGFRIITRILAREEHHVTDFVIDVHQLTTGLNCHIFDHPCEELDNFMCVLERPGFRRLDLSLLVGGLERYEWISYRSGRLKDALSKASDLEHISLHTDLDKDVDGAGPGLTEHFVPLRTIFPIEKWSRLQHFGLSHFLVIKSDLISFLAALPNTLRTVELSYLSFLGNNDDHASLLNDMRNTLGWRHKAPGDRPRVSMAVHTRPARIGRTVWIDNEVHSFLYEDGDNPFGKEAMPESDTIFLGTGIETDEFDPSYRRPYAHNMYLAELGITRLDEYELECVAHGLSYRDFM